MVEQLVSKVVLTGGKTVLLRELKIKHSEIAAQAASSRSNGDPNVLMILMQKELMKQLICQINDKAPSAAELEDMDALFSMIEYGQLCSVVKKLSGGDDMGKLPTVELVNFGSK